MPSFNIQSTGADAESIEIWKKAWMEYWDRKKGAKVHMRPGSIWVVEEPLPPLCPYHFKDCYMDESLRNFKDWIH